MEKQINLNEINFIAINQTPFTVGVDKELIFSINTKYEYEDIAITLIHDTEIETERLNSSKYKVDDKFLKAGELKIHFTLLKDGKIVKKWVVLPFIITEINNELQFYNELEELKKRIQTLEDKHKVTL